MRTPRGRPSRSTGVRTAHGPHIVGVGAYAGGLDALERLFKAMPLRTGAAFVVVQHHSTDFKSHMEQLLARQTPIRIQRVEDGMRMEADTIYLITAGKPQVPPHGEPSGGGSAARGRGEWCCWIRTSKTGYQEGRERLGVIKRNGRCLLQLINDIPAPSKVEAGVLEIATCETRLPELLADVRELLEVRTVNSPAELRFESLTPLPETVLTQPVRLRQILVKLVGNALKFTASGRVLVLTSIVEVIDLHALRIDVVDTGIGIAPESLEHIFEPFQQVQRQGDVVRADHGGTGLGLTITRRLVQALGGRSEVTSERGVGGTFSITLQPGPLDDSQLVVWDLPATNGAQADAEPLGQAPDLASCHVLVADDKHDVGRVARFFLEEVGASVTVVENGRQAVDAVLSAENGIDVVLMDIRVPITDGLAATEKLRSEGYRGRIVVLTAGAIARRYRALLRFGIGRVPRQAAGRECAPHDGGGAVATADGHVIQPATRTLARLPFNASRDYTATQPRLHVPRV